MKYSELVEVYEALGATTKRLAKIDILAQFLKKLHRARHYEWIYLLRGRVLPDYDPRELGLSGKLAIKAISKASGVSISDVVSEYNKVGDLGEVAEIFMVAKKQSTLFSSKLNVLNVFDNFTKILSMDGKGSVEKKLGLISELLTSASGKEAKYIVRTILGILRVGVADSTLRDSIAEAFFADDKKQMSEKIEEVYDLANDFAVVFQAAVRGKKELDKIKISPGKPMHVMLPVKVNEIKEGFRICGKPAACFPKGELIFSNPSIKQIENLEQENLVIGKNGKFQKILESFERQYNGELIKIYPSYLFPFSVTPEHRILVIRKNLCSWKNRKVSCRPNCQEQKYGCKKNYQDYREEWIEAGSLEKGDFVLFPKFKEIKLQENIDLRDFNKDKKIELKPGFIRSHSELKGTFKGKWIKNPIKLSKEFFELLGWYLAEGSLEKGGIRFSLGYKEINEAERIRQLVKNVFGIEAKLSKIGSVIEIRVHSVFLPDFFRKSFGNGSKNKNIPEFVMYSDPDKIKEFIKAYIEGDGHRNKMNIYEINTASKKIAYQMILLLTKIGILPSTGKYPNRGLGETIYRIVIFGKQLDRLEENIHNFKTNHQRFFEDEGFFYIPIRKVESLNYVGPVFNFETEDNTYLSSAIVHNCEHKYDGFRVVISKNNLGEIKLFTRRLDDVTAQFPDVVKVIEKNVVGKSFILDSEVVGYEPKTKKYKPFEAISQRIKRKYHIEELVKKLPVEVNVFDIMYLDGKSLIAEKFSKRRKLLEKVIKTEKFKIRSSFQIVTSDEKKAYEFYRQALKLGEEGIMFKKLDSPYKPGRRVGHIVKMKPEARDLDLVIVGAEHGTGKRAGWLTSYIVACRDEKTGKFLDVGKVASGLKEKEEEGVTYRAMTKMLNKLIIDGKGNRVKVKPKIIVAVTYQNIQVSPTYSSGYALRFPRIVSLREDKPLKEINTLKDIKEDFKKNHSSWKSLQ